MHLVLQNLLTAFRNGCFSFLNPYTHYIVSALLSINGTSLAIQNNQRILSLTLKLNFSNVKFITKFLADIYTAAAFS